jgi:hypothetical protein
MPRRLIIVTALACEVAAPSVAGFAARHRDPPAYNGRRAPARLPCPSPASRMSRGSRKFGMP